MTVHAAPTVDLLHTLVCSTGGDRDSCREAAETALELWSDGMPLLAGTLQTLVSSLSRCGLVDEALELLEELDLADNGGTSSSSSSTSPSSSSSSSLPSSSTAAAEAASSSSSGLVVVGITSVLATTVYGNLLQCG
eukprot:COSAG05_NODE_1772_length_4112_cov_1.452529_2_plen_136_part_00